MVAKFSELGTTDKIILKRAWQVIHGRQLPIKRIQVVAGLENFLMNQTCRSTSENPGRTAKS